MAKLFRVRRGGGQRDESDEAGPSPSKKQMMMKRRRRGKPPRVAVGGGVLDALREAIEEQNQVEIITRDGRRVGAPHRIIILRRTVVAIEFYQFEGVSAWDMPKGWKIIRVRDIYVVIVLRRRFRVRPDYNPDPDPNRGEIVVQTPGDQRGGERRRGVRSGAKPGRAPGGATGQSRPGARPGTLTRDTPRPPNPPGWEFPRYILLPIDEDDDGDIDGVGVLPLYRPSLNGPVAR